MINPQASNKNKYSKQDKGIIGLKHYVWDSDKNEIIPKIMNNYKINIYKDNNGNKVLNENLFKRNIKKRKIIYISNNFILIKK